MEFNFADVGEGIQDGTIVQWHVQPGDRVEEGAVLVDVETDKAVVEIPAPCSGIIESLGAETGEALQVGDCLIVIDDGDEGGDGGGDAGTVVGTLDDSSEDDRTGTDGAEPDTDNDSGAEEDSQGDTADEAVRATPAVRKYAREHNIDLTNIQGSGDRGRVMLDDVRSDKNRAGDSDQVRSAEDDSSLTEPTDQEYPELSSVRRTIARTMDESNKRPQVTHMDECNVTALKHRMEQSDHTATPYLVRAFAKTLKKHPRFNARSDGKLIVQDELNIGVAVDTEDGLMVPVLKNAPHYTVDGLAERIQELADACRERTIDREQLRGGTFTVTNIGFLGGTWATPLILPPQVAIGATGRIREKPVADDGAITTGYFLPVSLSFDHRFLDGADAARFVATLRDQLQEPGEL